jgi:hypothetical protein
MKLRMIFLFLILLCTIPAHATTRFISQSGGSASCGADGTQTTITAATFNATTNAPDDVNKICGTLTGALNASGILTLLGNGSVGHPVIIFFETGASVSAPDCNWSGNQSGCIVISTNSSPHHDVVVDGGVPCGWTWATGTEGTCNGTIVNTASGTASNQGTSTNGIEAESCTDCEFKNLGYVNLYVQSGGDVNANPQNENCISFSGVNVSIHDSSMHDVGWCLWYKQNNGDSNIQVFNNEIYNTPHPVNFAAGNTGTASNAFFYQNHFHDFGNWDTSGCVYHVEGFHSDGNGGTSTSGAVFNGLYLYNNFFGPNIGSCMFADIFWSPNVNGGSSAALVNNSYAFNNVAMVDNLNGGDATAIAGNNNHMFNNTWINTAAGNNGEAFNFSNISNKGYTYTWENNIVQGFWNDVANQDATSTGLAADYNIYSQCPSNGVEEGNCLLSFGNPGSSWSGYIASAGASGQESHSQNTGLFLSGNCCTGTLNINLSTFIPNSGSPAVGGALNLHSVCAAQPTPGLGALCFDARGNARPVSAAWDGGAMNFSSGGSAPTGPSNILPISIPIIVPAPPKPVIKASAPSPVPSLTVGTTYTLPIAATGCGVLGTSACGCSMSVVPSGWKVSFVNTSTGCTMTATVLAGTYSASTTQTVSVVIQ